MKCNYCKEEEGTGWLNGKDICTLCFCLRTGRSTPTSLKLIKKKGLIKKFKEIYPNCVNNNGNIFLSKVKELQNSYQQ